MTTAKTLIVGFGNVLLGDDGFGIEVVQRLAASPLSPHIEAMDVGIGGMHFVLRLMDGFQALIVVDAVQRGQPPGTLYIFSPDDDDLKLQSWERVDPHGAEPVRAMRLAKALGYLPEKVTVVGCEPATCQPGIGLSVAVGAAVECAVEQIRQLVLLLDGGRIDGAMPAGTHP